MLMLMLVTMLMLKMKVTTMDMRTSTSILSSGLCRDFLGFEFSAHILYYLLDSAQMLLHT